jgi:hypothetical protein
MSASEDSRPVTVRFTARAKQRRDKRLCYRQPIARVVIDIACLTPVHYDADASLRQPNGHDPKVAAEIKRRSGTLYGYVLAFWSTILWQLILDGDLGVEANFIDVDVFSQYGRQRVWTFIDSLCDDLRTRCSNAGISLIINQKQDTDDASET